MHPFYQKESKSRTVATSTTELAFVVSWLLVCFDSVKRRSFPSSLRIPAWFIKRDTPNYFSALVYRFFLHDEKRGFTSSITLQLRYLQKLCKFKGFFFFIKMFTHLCDIRLQCGIPCQHLCSC